MRAILFASLAALALGACQRVEGQGGPSGAVEEPSSETLAEAIDDGDFDRLDQVIDTSGLETVLDGVGPYTLLAPTDDAFEAAETDLLDPALRPQAIVLLRAHIVPGVLTRADIVEALDRAGGEPVEMRTMGEGVLSFRREGDTLLVAAGDGVEARLTGEESVVANGVVQPVDALLVPRSTGSGAG